MTYMMYILIGQVNGTWPMWGGDPTHVSVQLMRGAITIPVIKWSSVSTIGIEWQFSGMDDVDGDGQTEVIVGTWFDAQIVCLRGSDGSQKWTTGLMGPIFSSPAISDCDGDGQKEIVVGSQGGIVYCLRGSDGTEKWRFVTGDSVWSGPTIIDCDGDGQNEIVVGSQDGNIYCLRGLDGAEKWRFVTGDDVKSAAAAADCDEDGDIEIVVGSYNGNIYCLRGSNGTEKWRFATGGQVWSSPVIADCNSGRGAEVIVGSCDGKVYCLRGTDGGQVWAFSTGDTIRTSPVVADVDGDGQLDVIIGSHDRRVYCLDGSDGTPKWISSRMPSLIHTPGALADIDGDGLFEYLVAQAGYEPDTLYCLNAEDGSLCWKIALANDIHSPFAGDIDDDGCIEVVAGTWGPVSLVPHLFIIDDPQNSSGCGPLYEDIGEDRGSGPPEFRPMGKGLYLFLPKDEQVSLSLYDVSGKLVQKMYDGVLRQGSHTFVPTTETRGVYLAVLSYQGGIKTLKIVR